MSIYGLLGTDDCREIDHTIDGGFHDTNYIQSFVYDTNIDNEKNISSRIASTSEASASELLQDIEETFLQYYMDSDAAIDIQIFRFKYSKPQRIVKHRATER